MALRDVWTSEFAPQQIALRTKTVLRLVPNDSSEVEVGVSNQGFIAIIASIFLVGLLALLLINTALTSGAFTMENLKLQLASMSDQRDATLNQVATFASPNQLAVRATKLGMQPEVENNFLSLTDIKP